MTPRREGRLSTSGWGFVRGRAPRASHKGRQVHSAGRHRRAAGRSCAQPPAFGTITFLQRFSSSLTPHLYFHVLALDGVDLPGPTSDAPPVFVPFAVPTREQLLHLVTTVARRGRLITDGHVANEDAELTEPVQKLFDDDDPPPVREEPSLHAAFDGFDLHAGTTIDATTGTHSNSSSVLHEGTSRQLPPHERPRKQADQSPQVSAP